MQKEYIYIIYYFCIIIIKNVLCILELSLKFIFLVFVASTSGKAGVWTYCYSRKKCSQNIMLQILYDNIGVLFASHNENVFRVFYLYIYVLYYKIDYL